MGNQMNATIFSTCKNYDLNKKPSLNISELLVDMKNVRRTKDYAVMKIIKNIRIEKHRN